MSRKKNFIRILIPLLVIVLGIIIMLGLISQRRTPKREKKDSPGVLVETYAVQKRNRFIMVYGTGTVEAAQEVSVTPQVSGRITYLAPSMVVGGFFKKGETLFAIEDIDYRLALDEAKAARTKAEYELAMIESQARIGRTEWERLSKDSDIPPNPLVLYEPQLKNAQAALESSNAFVKQAEIDLERTTVRAPFNCRVRSESIDAGQYVQKGNSVALLSGTDAAEVIVPLPMEEIQWLEFPGPGEEDQGSPSFVSLTYGDRAFEWQGSITRSTGEVDPKTRMMGIVVQIQDPYGLLQKRAARRPVLPLGEFVQVRLQGKKMEGVTVIPRRALREDSTVWIMDSADTLRIQEVVLVRIEQEEALLTEGLEEGDLVVLTNITGAAEGMKLRQIEN